MYTEHDINTMVRRSTKIKCASIVEYNTDDKSYHITMELNGKDFANHVKVQKTITSKQMKLMNYQFYKQILEPMIDAARVQ